MADERAGAVGVGQTMDREPCPPAPPRALCAFGSCVLCDVERFCIFDEKEQVRNPMRLEFGTADWIKTAMKEARFIAVNLQVGTGTRGKHQPRLDPFRPRVPDVVPLVKAYYAQPGNQAGGTLHIVLDDGNVDDEDVAHCLQRAQTNGDVDGAALARVLLTMSKTQRRKLAGV